MVISLIRGTALSSPRWTLGQNKGIIRCRKGTTVIDLVLLEAEGQIHLNLRLVPNDFYLFAFRSRMFLDQLACSDKEIIPSLLLFGFGLLDFNLFRINFGTLACFFRAFFWQCQLRQIQQTMIFPTFCRCRGQQDRFQN